MSKRVAGFLTQLVLTLVVLVVGHDLDLLAAYGAAYGRALAPTGHDPRWETAVLTVLAVGLLTAVAAVARLVWLVRLTRRVRIQNGGWRSNYAAARRRLVSSWARLLLASLVLFAVQENYERASVGLGLPGLAVLAPDAGVSPIVVFALVSLLVAAVSTLFRHTIAALEEQLAGRRPGALRELADVHAPRLDVPRPTSSILGRKLAGRAPPFFLST